MIKEMKSPISLLQAAAFLDLLAVHLVVSLIPNHVRKMGGNHIHVGLLGSIYAGFQLGSGPIMGSLSDIKGRKSILLMTLFVCSAAYVTIGLTSSIATILILRAILGIFKQTQMLTKALVPDYEKNESKQSAIYGKMAAISGIGVTLGPVIGGHIIEDNPEYGFTLLSFAVGVCFLCNAGITLFLPPTRTPENPNNHNRSQNVLYAITNGLKQSLFQLLKVDWPKYWDIFMFKILIGFAMSVYYSNYGFYLKTQYDLSPKHIGYIISFQAVIGSVASYFIGYINSFYSNDNDYSLRNFHVFSLLTLSLTGLILSYNVYWYAIWLIPLGIGNAIGRLVTLEMILNRSHGEHAGTLIGASNSVRSLSGVIAPMVAGFVGQYLGIRYVIYTSFASVVTGFIISYCCKKKYIKRD